MRQAILILAVLLLSGCTGQPINSPEITRLIVAQERLAAAQQGLANEQTLQRGSFEKFSSDLFKVKKEEKDAIIEMKDASIAERESMERVHKALMDVIEALAKRYGAGGRERR